MSERTEETSRLHRLALVSHDIRSALSDVVGGLDLVDGASLDPCSRLQLERARAAAETLARRVDDAVIALTGDPMPADTAGSPADGTGPLELTDLLRDLDRRWRGHATASALALRIDLAADAPLTVAVPAGPLERLLSNLLDNALKYAETGEIVLSVDLDAEGALRFCVQDDGPGFSDASLARLFGFGARPPGSAQPGTGLGLHIAQSLAEEMGGRIEADNRAARTAGGGPQGACVAFVLPAERWTPATADTLGTESARRLPDLTGRHALVADDAGTNQAVLARLLRRLGATVDTADDGETALSALRRGGYDLAVLDIHMPRRSGLEVIAEVRRMPGQRGRVLILAATAYVLQGERDAIYAAGADGLLAKPGVGLAALGRALARLDRAAPDPLPVASGAAGTAEAARGASPGATTAPHLAHLLDLAGPDEARELLDRLSADIERSAERLAEAAALRDASGVRAATHVLISLGGAVGAEALQGCMEAANAAAHRGAWAEIARLLDAADPPLAALRREVDAARGDAGGASIATVCAPREAPAP